MASKQIPKSKAKTAYGLLGEIRALILAEPLRYDQRDTLTIIHERDRDAWDDAPACGTIGCVAGWVTALKASRPSRIDGMYDVLHYARRKLGLREAQANRLFNPWQAGSAPRGPQHAKDGAAHIARFQKEHRAQLLAKKV